MLLPKRTKYRKHMRGNMAGYETRGTAMEHGTVALKATEPGWITSRQIEAARRAMSRSIKRGGKIWIRVYPDKSVTQKAAETRMGSGKGNPEYWVAVVKPGKILFEINGVAPDLAINAMKLAAQKLPIKCIVLQSSQQLVCNPEMEDN
jgi:large subunit ribosomal protein L16